MKITFGPSMGLHSHIYSTSRLVYADGQMIGEAYRRRSGYDFVPHDEQFLRVEGVPFRELTKRIVERARPAAGGRT